MVTTTYNITTYTIYIHYGGLSEKGAYLIFHSKGGLISFFHSKGGLI